MCVRVCVRVCVCVCGVRMYECSCEFGCMCTHINSCTNKPTQPRTPHFPLPLFFSLPDHTSLTHTNTHKHAHRHPRAHKLACVRKILTQNTPCLLRLAYLLEYVLWCMCCGVREVMRWCIVKVICLVYCVVFSFFSHIFPLFLSLSLSSLSLHVCSTRHEMARERGLAVWAERGNWK